MNLAKHYTGPDWVNKKSGPTGGFPTEGKRARNRDKSVQTKKVQAMLRRLTREGVL